MKNVTSIGIAAASVLVLANCSSTTTVTTPNGSPQPPNGGEVVVVTHDSFAVPDEVRERFEESTGLTVTFVAPGDGGSLVNQLILTKDAPLGDVAFGVDNTFAARALEAGVFTDYVSNSPAASDAAHFAIPGSTALTAIDYSDVCLNVDLGYFEERGVEPPATFDDLTSAEYRGLVSVTNAATSSPGLAFLLATIAAKGDGWQEYWAQLKANDVRVTPSWSDTYYTDFSAPNYGGEYPVVLSYASSPPFEVIEGEPTTAALLDTCFRQVEYAGVLEGARNPEGGRAVVDWLLSNDFQASVAESMYVYPVSSRVELPATWLAYAPLAPEPWFIAPDEIAASRDAWIAEWSEIVES